MIPNEKIDEIIQGWKSFYPQAYSTQQEVIEDFIGDLEHLKEINNADGNCAH